MSFASALFLGFVLGLKHAVDADHLAAVSTIVTERSGLLRSSLVGALWGLGHGLALLPAAIAVIVLRLEIGAGVAALLELGVAVMLIWLALRTLLELARGATLHLHVHRHGAHRHVHLHLHAREEDLAAEHDHVSLAHDHAAHPIGVRPLLVGMVHGLAGSAALMLLVLSTIPSPALGLVYVAVFAAGSTLGMVATSLVVGLPMQLTASRFAGAGLALRGLAGCASLGVGLTMIHHLATRGA